MPIRPTLVPPGENQYYSKKTEEYLRLLGYKYCLFCQTTYKMEEEEDGLGEEKKTRKAPRLEIEMRGEWMRGERQNADDDDFLPIHFLHISPISQVTSRQSQLNSLSQTIYA